MTQSLEELIRQINETKLTASMELDEVPWQNRPGWAIQIGNAQAALPKLQAEYKDRLLASSLAIFVSGDRAKAYQFASIAKDEGDTITLDAEELYSKVAMGVERTFGSDRNMSAGYLPYLIQGLKEALDGLGLSQIPAPRLTEVRHLPTFQSVVDYARELVRAASGDDLNRLYLAKQLQERALETCYTGKVVPIVILNATPAEIASLSGMFAKVGAQVNVDELGEVNADTVLSVFKKTKKPKKGTQADDTETNKTDDEK